MEFLFSVIALVVAIMANNRSKRLEALLSERNVPAAPVAEPVSVPEAVVAARSYPPTAAPVAAPAAEPSMMKSFVEWFSVDWTMKLGALLLFLGIGLIVTTVFWVAIGPVGRVLLGFFLGIGILSYGSLRIRSFRNQGGVLLALGAGVVYLTVFAARESYDLFSLSVALAFMFLTAAYVAYVSVVEKELPLAVLGLLLGGVAPMLTSSPSVDFVGLFSYLLVLSSGTLWVARLTGWRVLSAVSIGFYIMYALPFFDGYGYVADDATKVLFAVLFASLYFLVNIFSTISDGKAEKWDLAVAMVNAIVLLVWITSVIPPEYRGLAALFAAVIASAGAFVVSRLTGINAPVIVHSAAATVFIGAATAFELDGPALTIAYVIEAAVAVFGAWYLFGAKSARVASLVAFIPGLLSLGSIVEYGRTCHFAYRGACDASVLNGDFAVILLFGLSLLSFGYLFRRGKEDDQNATLSKAFFILGAIFLLILLWDMTHRMFEADIATMVSLVAYTIGGLVTYSKGKLSGRDDMRISGIALLVFVIGHLLFVDIAQMDDVGRIVTFVVIGLLLMSTTFIGRKHGGE